MFDKGDDFGDISVSEMSEAKSFNENVDKNQMIQRNPVEAPIVKKDIPVELQHSLKGPVQNQLLSRIPFDGKLRMEEAIHSNLAKRRPVD